MVEIIAPGWSPNSEVPRTTPMSTKGDMSPLTTVVVGLSQWSACSGADMSTPTELTPSRFSTVVMASSGMDRPPPPVGEPARPLLCPPLGLSSTNGALTFDSTKPNTLACAVAPITPTQATNPTPNARAKAVVAVRLGLRELLREASRPMGPMGSPGEMLARAGPLSHNPASKNNAPTATADKRW